MYFSEKQTKKPKDKKLQNLILLNVNVACGHSLINIPAGCCSSCVCLSCPVICVYPQQCEIMEPELLTEACPVSVSKHKGIMKWTHWISHKRHMHAYKCVYQNTHILTVTCTYSSSELTHCNRYSSF